MDIVAESPHVGDHIVNLLVRQQIPKRRHNLREPTRWPAMHDHCLPVAVGLRRRPSAVRKVRKRICPRKNRTRRGSTLPFAPVTRDAATLVDFLSIPHIWTVRIVERLCGKKQRGAKKHDNPNDKCTRRSRQRPVEESPPSVAQLCRHPRLHSLQLALFVRVFWIDPQAAEIRICNAHLNLVPTSPIVGSRWAETDSVEATRRVGDFLSGFR